MGASTMTFPKHTLDYLAATVVMAFGLVVAIIASGYPQGSLLRPGSGLVPLVLGCLIIVLGAGVMIELKIRGAAAGEPQDTDQDDERVPLLRQVIVVCAVSGGMIAFALLLEPAGIITATLALILLSGFAEPKIRWVSLIVLAVCMALSSVVVFIWGFNLPLAALGPVR